MFSDRLRGWLETGAGPGEVYRTDLLPALDVDLAQVFRT